MVSGPRHGARGSDAPDGRGARLLESTWDPDPTDGWVSTGYAFLLREAGGTVYAVHETHRTGLFSRELWLALLTETRCAAGPDGADQRGPAAPHAVPGTSDAGRTTGPA